MAERESTDSDVRPVRPKDSDVRPVRMTYAARNSVSGDAAAGRKMSLFAAGRRGSKAIMTAFEARMTSGKWGAEAAPTSRALSSRFRHSAVQKFKMLDEFEEGSIFCSILPRMEGKAYRALRATRRKGLCPSTSTIVAGFLLLLLSLLTALPFLVVKTTSLDEANSVCFAKRGIPRTDTDVASFVYPAHVFDVVATWVHMLCFLLWLYTSPHLNRIMVPGAQALDRTLGTFYAFRTISGMLAIAFQFGWLCSSSEMYERIAKGSYLAALFMMTAVCTLLSHRYMLAKATIMASMSGGLSSKSNRSLKRSLRKQSSKSSEIAKTIENISNKVTDKIEDVAIESSSIEGVTEALKWESRACIVLPPPLAVVYLGWPQATLAVGVTSIALVVIPDVLFSILCTKVFLQPILESLGMIRDSKVRKKNGYKRVLATKHFTLIGTIVTMFASTLLWTNLLVYFIKADSLVHNYATHPFVTTVYLCSVLNSLGMLVVSGYGKKYLHKSAKVLVIPAQQEQPCFDSHAYDNITNKQKTKKQKTETDLFEQEGNKGGTATPI